MSDLVTLTRAKQSPTVAVITPVTYISTLISAASERIEKYCRRGIASATYTDELYDGDGRNELQLREFPLITLTSVTVIQDDDTDSSLTVGNLRNNADEGLLRFSPAASGDDYIYFPRGFQNIKITYIAGYATVPEDVQEGCVLLIEDFYDRHFKTAGVAAEKLGQYQINFSALGKPLWNELPEGVIDLIAPYRDKLLV